MPHPAFHHHRRAPTISARPIRPPWSLSSSFLFVVGTKVITRRLAVSLPVCAQNVLTGCSRGSAATMKTGSELRRCLNSYGAGGGTRTLKLSRAPAPKAGMFAKFHHARSVPILPLKTPTNLSVTPRNFGLITPPRGARSAEEFEAVQRLIAVGMNDCAIARQTGIPRRTVWEWRYYRPPIRTRLPCASSPCGIDHDFAALPPAAYCYLLGLYPGDGCISPRLAAEGHSR
jgi:hypothetical protein